MVEGVATQQQQLDQVPRDVASWFIKSHQSYQRYQVSHRVSHIQICQSHRSHPSHHIDDWHMVKTTIISKLATCNIEPPGQMGQSEALVDWADVGYAISGVDDNTWKSSQ